MISTFLKSSNHNLKYVGIDALSRIVRINSNYANEHQIAVIDCLEDPDETLKKKTLELLFKMTSPNNVEVCLIVICCAVCPTQKHSKSYLSGIIACSSTVKQFAEVAS